MFPIIAAIASGEEETCYDATTAAFLTTYNPPEAEYAVDDIYPRGKEMLKSWWNAPTESNSFLVAHKAAGWTAVGPWEGRPRCNEFLNSSTMVSQGSQVIKLSPGDNGTGSYNYDVWMKGTGSIVLSGAVSKTLTEADGVYTFGIATGASLAQSTLTVTYGGSGTVTHVQVQRGYSVFTNISTDGYRNIDHSYIRNPKAAGLYSIIFFRAPCGVANSHSCQYGGANLLSDIARDVEAEMPKFLAAESSGDTIRGYQNLWEEAIISTPDRLQMRNAQAAAIRANDTYTRLQGAADRSSSAVYETDKISWRNNRGLKYTAFYTSQSSMISKQHTHNDYYSSYGKRENKPTRRPGGRSIERLYYIANTDNIYLNGTTFTGEDGTVNTATSNYSSTIDGYKKIVTPTLWGMWDEMDDYPNYANLTSEQKQSLYERVYMHDLLLWFNKGMKGIRPYHWNNCTTEQRDAVNNLVELLTNNNIDHVVLWGDKRTDLTISGPTARYRFCGDDTTPWYSPTNRASADPVIGSSASSVTYAQATNDMSGKVVYCSHCSTYEGFVEPQIDWVNIQYLDSRYIIAVNTANDSAYSFTISGVPENCIKAVIISSTDYENGEEHSIRLGGHLDFRLQGLGHIIVKLEHRSTGEPPPPSPSPATFSIAPDSTYPNFWNVNGTRTLLRGAPITGELYTLEYERETGDTFENFLDDYAAAGGNYIRCTLADFCRTVSDRIYPFFKRTDGKYNLDQWNTTWWTRFEDFISYCETKGIVVQVEITDPWFMRNNTAGTYNWWSDGPWAPGNNVNYSEIPSIGFITDYRTNSLTEHPIYKVITNSAMATNSEAIKVRGYIQKFVVKLAEVANTYGNVLFQADNESPAGEAYSKQIADWIHAEYPQALITDMSSDSAITTASGPLLKLISPPTQSDKEYLINGDFVIQTRAKNAINTPSKFKFADCSQHNMVYRDKDNNAYGTTRDETFLMWTKFRDAMKASGSTRPINNTKIYRWPGPWSNSSCGDSKLSTDRFFISIFSGNAAAAFHPSEIHQDHVTCICVNNSSCGGDGFTDGGVSYPYPDTNSDTSQALTAAKWINDHADIDLAKFVPIPLPTGTIKWSSTINNRWSLRNPHECYGMEDVSSNPKRAIFFWTAYYDSNQIQRVKFDFTPWGTGNVDVSWYNLDTSATSATNRVAISTATSLDKPQSAGRWFCLVKKV